MHALFIARLVLQITMILSWLAGNDVLCYAVAAVCYCATWAMSQVCCCSVVVLVAGFTLELIFAMSSMLYCCFSCFHFCFLISYFATAFFVAFLYLAYQSKEKKKSCYIATKGIQVLLTGFSLHFSCLKPSCLSLLYTHTHSKICSFRRMFFFLFCNFLFLFFTKFFPCILVVPPIFASVFFASFFAQHYAVWGWHIEWVVVCAAYVLHWIGSGWLDMLASYNFQFHLH